MALYLGNKRLKLQIGSYSCHLNLGTPLSASYLTFSSPSVFSIYVNEPLWDGSLEYSLNTRTWASWDGSKITGKVVYIRGTKNTKIGGNADKPWSILGTDVSCRGNIENLLDYKTVKAGEHPAMAKDCYLGMFRDCTGLISSPELPATALTERCYASMFRNCSSLLVPPELPATTLTTACYLGMFFDCTSLESIPELPATELPIMCYCNMFKNCAKIRLSPEQTDVYTKPYRVPVAGSGAISGPTSLQDMFANTGGVFSGTPSINTTYYLHEPDIVRIASSDNIVLKDLNGMYLTCRRQ